MPATAAGSLQSAGRARAGFPGGAVPVHAERSIVTRAVLDAIDYRTVRTGAWCSDCDAAGDGLCPSRLDDLHLLGAYRRIAEQLTEG